MTLLNAVRCRLCDKVYTVGSVHDCPNRVPIETTIVEADEWKVIGSVTQDPLTYHFEILENDETRDRVAEGYVKWDGCMNINEHENHFCSIVNVGNWCNFLKKVFDEAEKAGCKVWRP